MWDAIVNGMKDIFSWLHELIITLGVPAEKEGLSYVLAVILFTVIIRLLILPLNIKATKSNAKMQEIQPEMKKLQDKYKNDPQKLQLETSKLMKENNVSMFGGCLPSLLPMPILFALYYVFRGITPTEGADLSFLGIENVFAMGGIQVYTIILAILAVLSTYVPSLLLSKTMPKPEEGGMNMNTMNVVMAGMMGMMSFQFPPLLIIYWITGGIIQLIQTYFLNYIPAMKKKKAKEEAEELQKIAKAKKSTPKTKKR